MEKEVKTKINLEQEIEKYLTANAKFLIESDSKLTVQHMAEHFFKLGIKNHIEPNAREPAWSEDEKIRKQIINFLKEFEYDHYRNLDFRSWIDWLEKQEKKNEWLFEEGKWYVKLCHDYEGDLRHFEKGYAYKAVSEVQITDGYHNVSLSAWQIPRYFRLATKDEIPKETEQTSKLNEDEEIRNYFITAIREQSNIHQEWKEKCLNWLEK